jgi:aminoglycoside 6'-N-acetyltransferase I
MQVPHIRIAQSSDRNHWLRFRRLLWPHCSEQKHKLEMGQLLRSAGVVYLAEYKGGNPIGFAEVSVRQDHVDGASICPVPYLEAWFVDEPFRKHGVGRALMAAVEQWASSRGYTELASDAEIENAASIRLHKMLGFSEVDRNVTFLKKLTNAQPKKSPRAIHQKSVTNKFVCNS